MSRVTLIAFINRIILVAVIIPATVVIFNR